MFLLTVRDVLNEDIHLDQTMKIIQLQICEFITSQLIIKRCFFRFSILQYFTIALTIFQYFY